MKINFQDYKCKVCGAEVGNTNCALLCNYNIYRIEKLGYFGLFSGV